MKKIFFALAIVFCSTGQAQLVRFLQVDSNLYRSGQPESAADYETLRKHGIKTIINLRNDSSVADAELAARRHGFTQVNIPLSTETTREEYYAAVKKIFSIINTEDLQPVLV